MPTFPSRPANGKGPNGLPFYAPDLKSLYRLASRDFAAIFETQQLVDGHYVQRLENLLAERYQRHVVATCSGTAGLIIALDSVLTKDKPEVLVTSLTFAATVQAVLHAGGRPVFVDVDPQTWNMSPEDVERKITLRTGAILPTHLFGVPCDHDALSEISRRFEVPLVYDSCEAFGTTLNEREIGCFGDAEVFSLDATKVVSGGLGGYVTTGDPALARKLRMAKSFGNDDRRATVQRGINARMLEFSAAMAIHSLRRASAVIREGRAVADCYLEACRNIPFLRFQAVPQGSLPARQLFAVALDCEPATVVRLRKLLAARGIEVRAYFRRLLHQEEIFGGGPNVRLPVTEELGPRILCLPVHKQVRPAHIETLVRSLQQVAG
ncbi:MAG: DegT/DnrJ/EryC1/StrS family aminotransferase [Terriglobia bacterium]